MKFLSPIKQLFFTDPEMFKNITGGIADENRRCLQVTSCVAMVIFAIFSLGSAFTSSITDNLPAYVSYTIVSLVFFVLSEKIRSDAIVQPLVYAFIFVIISFGIVLGAIFSPNELSVSYIALMFAIPLLFTARPIMVNSIVVVSMIIYTVISCFTQTGDMLLYNLLNVICYGVISMLASAFVMNVKIQRIHYKEVNRRLEKIDKEAADRRQYYDRFITDMIRKASTGSNPEQAIDELLQYVGENLNADRAYIFENINGGNYSNTYEWCRNDISSKMNEYADIWHSGMIEVCEEQFRSGKNVIIRDINEIKDKNDSLYRMINASDFKSIVAGPIIIDKTLVGFYGVYNSPAEYLDRVSELLATMEFAFEMMFRFRDGNRRIEESAKRDPMTGCKNRKALDWIYNNSFLSSQPVGIVMCDLNGLKRVNDTEGHEAGDLFINRTAEMLKQLFGKDNIYRIGGDEFIAVLVGSESDGIEKKVEDARAVLGDSASLGLEFTKKMTASFDELLKAADQKMYTEKKKYYGKHADRHCRSVAVSGSHS